MVCSPLTSIQGRCPDLAKVIIVAADSRLSSENQDPLDQPTVIDDTNGAHVNSPFPLDRNSTVKPQETLTRYVGQPFPTADQILLCCFGTELADQRTYQELRQVLTQAGFAGPVVRHLIGASPVVRRAAKGYYRIRPFED